MKIVKPSVEFFGAVPTDYENALKFIEMAGRTCYRSEDRITTTSAEGFVKRLIKAGHLAMVEHSNFVVRHDLESCKYIDALVAMLGKFLTCEHDENYIYFGGNLTAWFERLNYIGYDPIFVPFVKQYGKLFGMTSDAYSGNWEACPHDEIPKDLHRYSAKFICDRGVSHELVRHRPCSFAQESTRYVNYAGKDMEFIEPGGFEEWSHEVRRLFEISCENVESTYDVLIRYGLKPQQARAVLPNALRTEIVVTADAAEWAHIRKLRTSSAAHPDIQRVMNLVPWDAFLEENL
jgi:thymidylate synthase (FAD)